jgi:hypothetical protein
MIPLMKKMKIMNALTITLKHWPQSLGTLVGAGSAHTSTSLAEETVNGSRPERHKQHKITSKKPEKHLWLGAAIDWI